jgi:osmoprotectant transport system substrate-binding protein
MMGKMRGCRTFSGAVCFALAVLCAACTSAGNRGPPAQAQAAAHPGTAITVGSFDFPESVLLAYVYADALAAKGFPVRVLPDLGTRELVDPALMNGLIQIVPEYSGSALDFLSLGRQPATSNAAATYRSLARSVEGRGLVAAKPAPAQDGNAIVVTAATAARHHLRSIADLGGVAQGLVFGGPPECPERAYCLPGLARTYGLHFRAFTPTDAGGPLTLQALTSGQIGVGLLFTTDPSIPARHLVILADNGALQPAENITPLVRRDTVARYGPRLLAALDAVSARLSTTVLRHLDARVELFRQGPRRVADSWLRAQGLIPERQGAR